MPGHQAHEQIKDLFKRAGALRQGHFVLNSGRHSDTYVNKDAVYTDPGVISGMCSLLAWEFATDKINTVLGPALGGIILAQYVALHLSLITGRQVKAIYAEKNQEGGFEIRRGYDQWIKDQRILVVEDIMTTGKSAKQVVELGRQHGGIITGLALLWERDVTGYEQVGEPPKIVSLVQQEIKSWSADECPLCQTNTPVNTDVGKGRQFLEEKKTKQPQS